VRAAVFGHARHIRVHRNICHWIRHAAPPPISPRRPAGGIGRVMNGEEPVDGKSRDESHDCDSESHKPNANCRGRGTRGCRRTCSRLRGSRVRVTGTTRRISRRLDGDFLNYHLGRHCRLADGERSRARTRARAHARHTFSDIDRD